MSHKWLLISRWTANAAMAALAPTPGATQQGLCRFRRRGGEMSVSSPAISLGMSRSKRFGAREWASTKKTKEPLCVNQPG